MKICIDLTCLSYHLSGVERYALCITEEMLKQDHKNEYVLVFREIIHETFEKYIDNNRVSAQILYGNKKQLFLLWSLPHGLNKIHADCFLFLASKSPILLRKKRIINTIHDLVCWDYPDTMRSLQRIYSKVMNKNAAKVSERIITVSEFSKGRINSLLHYSPEKIVVAYSAVSNTLTDTKNDYLSIKEKYGLPEKYIMNLSTLEPRKNLELLLKAYDEIADKVDYDIVLIGRRGWKIDELMSSINANSRVHITGFVDDADVSQIYRHALCFVFPSLYEGFGLPPIEALSLGTPVLSSDAASLPEVLRKQADYFENNNKEALIEKLLMLNKESSLLPKKLDDFQKNHFQFSVSASIILKTINEVLVSK